MQRYQGFSHRSPLFTTNKVQVEWTHSAMLLGGSEIKSHSAFSEIAALYGKSDRHYHTLTHIAAMTDFLNAHARLPTRHLELTLAAVLHDVIYDSRMKDNEEQSAQFARDRLIGLNLKRDTIAFIADLILSTKKHQPLREGHDNALFLDADLSILGASPADYVRYTQQIRREYEWVPESDYREGRKAVLERFLRREQIFFVDSVRNELEPQARENIQLEIQLLSAE